jgi:aminopeptidase N
MYKHFLNVKLLILIVGLALMSNCKQATKNPDKGVSFELNEQRKRTLSEVSYQLDLDIPADKFTPINGRVVILVNIHSLRDNLIIDFNEDASNLSKIQIEGKEIPYTFFNEHIIIDPTYLKTGLNAVTIDFIAGNLSLNRNEDFLYTLFVPDRAATCFPLFDQPNLKASYEITLTIPAGWEAVSNGKSKEVNSKSGKTEIKFAKTKPISSYLVAFAAGKFNKVSRVVHDRSMTMYYRETDSVKVKRNLDDIFDLHGKSLAWLEDYTSIDYPFDKFDFVLIPSFQYGGMEHPGSIFYNESSFFLDEKASINRRMGRASLIAHETAHMWFGDLVTMDWFNDVWMKEVFANFMAAKIVQPSFPEIDHNLRFLLAHYPSAYEVDRSEGANPILQQLANLKNAGSLYGAIIYQKAPIVMRHLERKIGVEFMQKGLSEYLKKYSYGNATWDDLVSIIDSISDDDIKTWSNVWVKTAGMPAYDWSTPKSVEQREDRVSNRIWQQPLKIKRGYDSDITIDMLKAKPIAVDSLGDYNFLNSDGFSYGYFKMDDKTISEFLVDPVKVADPVFRASMWINCWESMIHGDVLTSELMVQSMLSVLHTEENPLVIDYLLSNLQTAWWTFLPESNRSLLQNELETILWELVLATPDAGKKNSYFHAYRNMVMSKEGLERMEQMWLDKLKVKDLILSEEDKMTMAYELALKNPEKGAYYLSTQLKEIKNPDRIKRFEFVMPALSNDQSVRDSFFESLKQGKNREHEPWVLEGLHYLHHPLMAKSSEKYLLSSLELLQEIQLTGDIFFPQRWLQTTFSGHSSAEAVNVVDSFLIKNPNYPHFLKNKILQSTDLMKRAVTLQESSTIK